MYKVCIFDLDGTLANTLSSIAYFSNEALTRCGLQTIPVEDYRTIVGNGVDTQVHRMMDRVCGAGRYTKEELDKLKKIYNQLYEENPTYMLQRYDGMDELLAGLKQAGLKLAVCSNKPDAWAGAVVDCLFSRGTFDICLGQKPGIEKKPSPQGALLIAQRLGVSPKECLYIGDTNTDMMTGSAAGMDTVGVLWGFRTQRELEEAHAKQIVQKPQEIMKLVACNMR